MFILFSFCLSQTTSLLAQQYNKIAREFLDENGPLKVTAEDLVSFKDPLAPSEATVLLEKMKGEPPVHIYNDTVGALAREVEQAKKMVAAAKGEPVEVEAVAQMQLLGLQSAYEAQKTDMDMKIIAKQQKERVENEKIHAQLEQIAIHLMTPLPTHS